MNRRVIILGPAWPLRGGIANFNEALYTAFEESGADVEIVSFSLQYPSILFPGKSQKESNTRSNPRLKIRSLVNSINPISWWRTARYMNQQQPNYVVVRFWLPFMAIALGSILRMLNKEIRIIALVDNAIPHEKRPGDTVLTKYFMKSPHAFIAMSRAVLNDLKGMTGSQLLRFVPHPVYNIYGAVVDSHTARNQLQLNPNDRIILFFGFIRKYKGLNILLDAMTDQRLVKMNVKLLIAGEFYDDPTSYKLQMEKPELKDRVILRDEFIPSAEIAAYFCAANIVAQTYSSATQSGVTQIAYHFGRPMLVTNVGGLAEIVPDGEVGYVTDVNADAVANALVDFFENDRERGFAEAAKEKSSDFSWSTMVKAMDELYNQSKSEE